MCGIIGIISKNKASVKKDLLEGLRRLEYRGYDSAGYSTVEGKSQKTIGSISDLISATKDFSTSAGIAHTRWATHGGVSEKNAHPHMSCDGKIMIVHNGIIENFSEIKEELIKSGHTFRSDTDTEVIAHFIEEGLKSNRIDIVIQSLITRFKGTFAIICIIKDENKIYAIKRDSPLVLGKQEDTYILASDIYAFSDKTNKAIFFNDDEYAVIDFESARFYDKKGIEIKKEQLQFEWKEPVKQSKKYPHHMIKEIYEEPEAVQRLLVSLATIQKNKVDDIAKLIKKTSKVIFLAAGTSYHAALFGARVFNSLGKETYAQIASDFNSNLIDQNTLVIAISQSGETMDVVKALKKVSQVGAKICSIVNVPYSTTQRMSQISIEIAAGQEICVAATKSYINQVTCLMYLANNIGAKLNLEEIPSKIEETITENVKKIKILAKELAKQKDIYVLGRDMNYGTALEIALKIKEISYIHAEGLLAGELKHGTLALIEKGTPVIVIIPPNDMSSISTAKEVEARGAQVIALQTKDTYQSESSININSEDPVIFSIYCTTIGQLLAYYIALNKKLPIDKPRNLAKSVTVE